ncbi:VOC family protein [Streptomyces hypolithicus]
MPEKPPALFAYLSYRDAPAAIEWLSALGFETVTRQDGDEGLVAHAELRLGDVVVMLASQDEEYSTAVLKERSVGHGLYIRVDAVGGFYDRAIAAGGTGVFPPESTAWGSRRARVLDPEGYEWSFGRYEPGHAWS